MWQYRFWKRIPRVVLVPVLALTICVLSLSLAASGSGASVTAQSAAAQPFTLTSPTFRQYGPLPLRSAYNKLGCPGKNIAPTLNWRGVPSGTASFALAMNDYDAPVAGGFHHWIVYNIPAAARTLNGSSPYSQGTNSFGFVGYGGPCPPATGQIHHYIFTLYAVTVAHISGKALTYGQLMQSISGKVAGATVAIGTFVLG